MEKGNGGWTAVYVEEIDALPLNFQLETIEPSLLRDPVSFEHTIFSTGSDSIYAFFRHPTTQKPFVRRLSYAFVPDPDPLGDQFNAILENLWAGADPAQVVDDLLIMANNPAFQPNAGYFYYLGLAYELSGDEDNAVTAYLRAWQEYCCDTWEIGQTFTTANPYAIMARAKLIPIP